MNILPLNTLFAGACILGAMAFVPAAQASLIVSESFDYSSGTLAGANGGTGWNGAWTAFGTGSNATVQTGSLDYTAGSDDLLTAGNKAYVTTTSGTSGVGRSLATAFSDATTQTIYLSFAFNWDEGTRFFGLHLVNDSTAVVEFNKFSGQTQTSFGIQQNSGGGVTAISTDTTYFVVARIDFNASGNDTVRLYVNPASLDTEPLTASSTYSTASISFNAIRLATGFTSGSVTTAATAFDEIRIGTSYADVVPSAIPEPASAAALLGVAALGAMGAGRRRR
jgi:PEP-CTERM putative exosortase interaction domain